MFYMIDISTFALFQSIMAIVAFAVLAFDLILYLLGSIRSTSLSLECSSLVESRLANKPSLCGLRVFSGLCIVCVSMLSLILHTAVNNHPLISLVVSLLSFANLLFVALAILIGTRLNLIAVFLIILSSLFTKLLFVLLPVLHIILSSIPFGFLLICLLAGFAIGLQSVFVSFIS